MVALPLAGLILVILFLGLILIKPQKERSDFFLALFFLFIGAELLYRYCVFSGYNVGVIWMVGFDLIYWILLGPVVWFYALFLIWRDRPYRPAMLLHLIPFTVVMIPYVQFLFVLDGKTNFFSWTYHHPVYKWIINVGWEFCVLFYLIATVILLIRFKRKLPTFFSSLKRKQLNWLLYLTSGFLGYIVVAFTMLILVALGMLSGNGDSQFISVVMLVGYMLGVGIFGYRQQGIFTENLPKEITNQQVKEAFKDVPQRPFKYEKSGLQDDESAHLLEALKRRMKTEQPYLDPELNLQDLATQLDTTIHKLSQIINERFKQNFYDFINTYRVEVVKQKLHDSRFNHLKVIAIAYDCGFNSKSAFYTSFRKITRMTPVEYRRKFQPERDKVFSN